MIIVGGVHDGLIFQASIRTGQHCDYVVGFERTDLTHHVRFQASGELHGSKVAILRSHKQLVPVLAGARDQVFCDFELYPGSDLQLRGIFYFQIRLLARI